MDGGRRHPVQGHDEIIYKRINIIINHRVVLLLSVYTHPPCRFFRFVFFTGVPVEPEPAARHRTTGTVERLFEAILAGHTRRGRVRQTHTRFRVTRPGRPGDPAQSGRFRSVARPLGVHVRLRGKRGFLHNTFFF